MKKIIALILLLTLSLSLCACNSLTDAASDAVHNALGNEAGNAFDNAVDQGRQGLENAVDEGRQSFEDAKEMIKNELQTKLQSELDEAEAGVKEAVQNKIDSTVDAVASTTIFTTYNNLSGNEIPVLANFAHAKLVVTLTEYPLGTKLPDPANESPYTFTLMVDGDAVKMDAMQCCAYARYVQTKLYGEHDKLIPAESPNFRNILEDYTDNGTIARGALTAEQLKEIITAAGPGAHLRTGEKNHSMIVVEVQDDGFTIIDANADGNMTIRQYTYTWSEYVSSDLGKRGFAYIKIYDPIPQ